MSTFVTTGARAIGLATLAADGTVLDSWFPAPELIDGIAASGSTRLSEAEAVAALGADVAKALAPCAVRGTTVVAVRTEIKSLADAPADTHDAYLRLHLLSHRLPGELVSHPYRLTRQTTRPLHTPPSNAG